MAILTAVTQPLVQKCFRNFHTRQQSGPMGGLLSLAPVVKQPSFLCPGKNRSCSGWLQHSRRIDRGTFSLPAAASSHWWRPAASKRHVRNKHPCYKFSFPLHPLTNIGEVKWGSTKPLATLIRVQFSLANLHLAFLIRRSRCLLFRNHA